MPDPLVDPRPAFDILAAERVADLAFGIRGTVTELGGERDRTFRVDADGGGAYVLKVANPADGPDVLELQAAALDHVGRTDPDLPFMRTVAPLDGGAWTSAVTDDGVRHLVRMFTFVPGRSVAAEHLDHDALHAYGAVVARTGRALRGFFHPSARYDILWDLRHAPRLCGLLDAITHDQHRALAAEVLDRFDARVAPAFDRLRAQVVHNDLTLDNVLLGDDHRVSGIVDVGDLTHTALVCDLAIALAGMMWRRPDPVEAAQAAIAGYASITPLERGEVDLLPDLVMARLVAWGTIAAWRAGRHPDNTDYITAGEDDAWTLLLTLEVLGPRTVARRLRTAALAGRVPYPAVPTAELVPRRRAVLGASPLAYADPVHFVAGEGVWLFDPDGRRYLDAYNNVPVVGHAHPDVTAAIAGQTASLATNTRYLHEAVVTLAERLVATMPDGLDTVVLVNSGSEANDLAWRLATAASGGRGAIVSEWAYHGITDATHALSPEVWPDGHRPTHVERVPAPAAGGPDTPADVGSAVDAITAAAATLADRGFPLAAMMLDPAFTSDGILVPPPAYLLGAAAAVPAAGGLLVVDEVQAGHGRCGSHLWSFAASGVVPDVVTLGKPMGNGLPVAAVVTRAEVAAALTDRTEVFSTFGGNPVSCVAALAVLDVIEAEGLLARAEAVGDQLRRGLERLAADHALVHAVRGRGLLVGVELRHDDDPRAPASAEATAVVDGLRRRGVLVGATGRHGNVLKLRPPLVFEPAHADVLLDALDAELGDIARTGDDRKVAR